jgi:hypothetical protein
MSELTPALAARIAAKVYDVREDAKWQTIVGFGPAGVDARLAITGNFSLGSSSGGRFTGTSGGNYILRASSGFGYIAPGVGPRQNELLIAVRGTASLFDGVTDLVQSIRIGPNGYPVHAGFKNTFDSFKPTIADFLSGNKPTTVHVVGHSLGGALATLVADFLSEQKVFTKLYTFGCPRTGFESFSRRLTQKLGPDNFYRVHHSADPVAMVPIYPFHHAPADKEAYSLPWEGSMPVSVNAHFMDNYIASVGDANWIGLKRAQPGTWGKAENWLEEMAKEGSGAVKMYSAKTLWMIMKCMDWILSEVIGRVVGVAALGTVTVVDAIAKLLYEGTLTSVKAGSAVTNLMIAIMKFLGRTLVKGISLTVGFIKWALDMLFGFLSTTAQQAMQRLDRGG